MTAPQIVLIGNICQQLFRKRMTCAVVTSILSIKLWIQTCRSSGSVTTNLHEGGGNQNVLFGGPVPTNFGRLPSLECVCGANV